MGEWISVSDMLPAENGSYLFYRHSSDEVYVTEYKNGEWEGGDGPIEVDYWMPLPIKPDM